MYRKWYFYPTHLLCFTLIWSFFCGRALLDKRIVGFIIWSIVIVIIMIRHYHICFPYISTLHITDKVIERRILGIKYTSLPREQAFVAPLHINNTTFVVFTLEELEHYSERDIMELSWRHKAIMYPITKEMRRDFPDVFDRFFPSKTT